MISNPCTFFINQSNEESFIYEGGNFLYHFSPYDNNLSNSLEMNLCYFADSENHALDVLKRMFEHMRACKIKYLDSEHKGANSAEFNLKAKKELGTSNFFIDAIDSGKIKVHKAPTNQFYVVGWAANDTI